MLFIGVVHKKYLIEPAKKPEAEAYASFKILNFKILHSHTEIFTPQVGKKTFWCAITPLWQVFKLGPVVIVRLFSRFQYHVGVY